MSTPKTIPTEPDLVGDLEERTEELGHRLDDLDKEIRPPQPEPDSRGGII